LTSQTESPPTQVDPSSKCADHTVQGTSEEQQEEILVEDVLYDNKD
jgi:hypothetical protein